MAEENSTSKTRNFGASKAGASKSVASKAGKTLSHRNGRAGRLPVGTIGLRGFPRGAPTIDATLRAAAARTGEPDAVAPANHVDEELRASAARIRMSYDQKRGHRTAGWIKKLAQGA